MIHNQLKEDIGVCLRNLCEHKKVQLIESHLMPVYSHMIEKI